MPDKTEGHALPRWQCHKKVWGDRIREVVFLDLDDKLSSTDDAGMRWILDCGVTINVTRDLVARGMPITGDYYVVYDDFYKSWSPAKAFEEGYTRID